MDNSVFCSGDFVIVLATEQDFAFKINDLHVVPVVPVFLGGMGRECEKYGSNVLWGKCTKKHSRLPIPYFFTGTEHTLYTIYIK